MSESERSNWRPDFGRRLGGEFHETNISSDVGMPTLRELDEPLELTHLAQDALTNPRTERSGCHNLVRQFRRAVFGRLAEQASIGLPMEISRVNWGLCIVSAILWQSTASATVPASAQQMVCLPAAFVIATVTDSPGGAHIPEYCKGPHGSCRISWPLNLRIDEILATRPSDLTAADRTLLEDGKQITLSVDAHPSRFSKDIEPEDFQGGLTIPILTDGELEKSIRNKKFLFGLGSRSHGNRDSGSLSEAPAQIWSMPFQGVLEATLLESAKRATPEKPNECPTLDEQKELEDATAAQPPTAGPLVALARLHERLAGNSASRANAVASTNQERFQANQLYQRAIPLDQSNEALSGFMHTLGTQDANWAVSGLGVARDVLARDPRNAVAQRLLIQSLIHEGQINLIDKADLSEGTFSDLDLSQRRIPHVKLSASYIGRLEAYEADLSYGDFTGVRIGSSGLWRSNLKGAVLDHADFGETALADANLSMTTGLKNIFSKDAAGSSFIGADLNGANIRIQQRFISFPLAVFYGDYLDIEDGEPSPRIGPRPEIHFARANLRNSNIRIDGMQIDFSGADLTDATIDLTDFRGADLSNAKLDGIKAYRSVYDCETKWPKNFSPEAEKLVPLPGPLTCARQLPLIYDKLALGGMNFAGLDLHRASFRSSNAGSFGESIRLVGADLTGADLRDADFTNAILENAHLDGVLYNAETKWPSDFDPRRAGAKFCSGSNDQTCP